MQTWDVRLATLADIEALQDLIVHSARGLNIQDYTAKQVESTIAHVYGVDTQLILDGTYFVILSGSTYVACGGWSKRNTLYGGDQYKVDAVDNLLDPATDAARIRAFFVHPDRSRQGLGSLLMKHCEEAACRAGFKKMELMATLTGKALYAHAGFEAVEKLDVQLVDGVSIGVIRMTKDIAD